MRDGTIVQGTGGPERISIQYRMISPDYFRALGIKILQGRSFNESDLQSSAGIVIINETFARRYWPGVDPVGKPVGPGKGRRLIVGVVADIKEMGLNQRVLPTAYIPVTHTNDLMTAQMNRWFLTSWIIRTTGPVKLDETLRQILKNVDSDLPVARIRPMTQVVSGSITEQRFTTTMMTSFAALALLLTTVGLYGVLSYQVSQRTQEIGIRVALGAQSNDVVKLFARQGLGLTLIGVAIGLVAALMLVRFVSSMLFEISATDLSTFALIPVLLVAVSMIACLIPALRATRVDPMIALRYD